MERHYRTQLFDQYHSTHVSHLDSSDQLKLEWFAAHVALNYEPLLNHQPKTNMHILELACNKGYLLKGLAVHRFQNLYGVDLSPDDVRIAKTVAPEASITHGDAVSYLTDNVGRFDAVILKALLEHVRKDDTLSLLEKINGALTNNGRVIVDVPNMDWLFASHERYMDFTHEVGFTKDSLAQVMRNVFDNVEIRRVRMVPEPGMKHKIGSVLRPWLISLASAGLKIVGEGAADVWWDCRSIIAIGNRRA